MDFSRNIIFITCLLSGICYSNAAVTGSSFFTNPITRGPYSAGTVPQKEVLKKFAEELICGDDKGWAANFPNTRQAPLINPCGMGKCAVSTDMSDYECDCFTGYKYDPITRTCEKSKSLVTCNPGTRRVAAEKLIVGRLAAGHDWASGTYERVAGEGYQNENLIENIHQGVPTGTLMGARNQISIQQYRHDVPIKGREYYVQYKVDAPTCDFEKDTATGKNIISATLSFNYKKNQWQFTNKDTAANLDFQVYSRETVKCVEDATEWFFTYTGTSHLAVGMVFVKDAATAAEFQIRDTMAIDSAKLAGISTDVQILKNYAPSATPTANVCPSNSDFIKLTNP